MQLLQARDENFGVVGLQLLAAAMALEQLGIAEHIVVVGFGITWGGLVLACAIAFGLWCQRVGQGIS